VIFKLKLLENFSNLLLISLFPTQMAIHFWPKMAFIFGIRIDYLAPTIYFTDILFIGLFIPWIIKERSRTFSFLKKHIYLIIMFLTIVLINLFYSTSIDVSLLKWIKIFEFLCLGYYISQRKDIFTLKTISTTLFFSTLFFSTLGILQFVKGETLDGIFYLLGERTFSIYTPGIAIVNMLGQTFLRVYSTFPHPNSFAGFLGISMMMVVFNYNSGSKLIKSVGLVIMTTTFVLTFSLSAFIAIFISAVLFFFLKNNFINNKTATLIIISLLVSSFYLAIFSRTILESDVNFPQSFEERLELANISKNIFSTRWIMGTGLNTSIIEGVKNSNNANVVWLLQPVHNIYLLIFTEVGIFGAVLMGILFYKILANVIILKNLSGTLIIVFVLITGFFDHYWFTIQQNMLLLALVFGIYSREKA